MGKVGWAIGAIILMMIIGLILAGEIEQSSQPVSNIDCEYETKYVNGKSKRVLDCD